MNRSSGLWISKVEKSAPGYLSVYSVGYFFRPTTRNGCAFVLAPREKAALDSSCAALRQISTSTTVENTTPGFVSKLMLAEVERKSPFSVENPWRRRTSPTPRRNSPNSRRICAPHKSHVHRRSRRSRALQILEWWRHCSKPSQSWRVELAPWLASASSLAKRSQAEPSSGSMTTGSKSGMGTDLLPPNKPANGSPGRQPVLPTPNQEDLSDHDGRIARRVSSGTRRVPASEARFAPM